MTRQTGSTGPRMLAGALLMAAGLAGPAAAQATHADSGLASHVPASGVLTPPAQIDPGMARPAPAMPGQSMPVIHPRQLRRTRHGAIPAVPR